MPPLSARCCGAAVCAALRGTGGLARTGLRHEGVRDEEPAVAPRADVPEALRRVADDHAPRAEPLEHGVEERAGDGLRRHAEGAGPEGPAVHEHHVGPLQRRPLGLAGVSDAKIWGACSV